MRHHTTAFLVSGVLVASVALLTACGGKTEPVPTPEQQDAPKTAAATTWNENTTVGEIVAVRPETARVFELVGIDYCCGGEMPLREAAAAGTIDVARLLGALAVVGPQGADVVRNWQHAPLPELMDHIVATHHTWLRRELPRIGDLVDTVTDVHGEAHPELAQVRTQFHALNMAIGPHLEDEEQHVFPAIKALVDGEQSADVEALLIAMRTDHDDVGAALHRINDLTSGFEIPEDACNLYREMLTGLQSLEHDLHQHVHLENNVLLPRALAELETN